MLNEYIIQSLKYLIDLSNGSTPEAIAAEADEESATSVVNYALQILDINSEEFSIAMTALNIEQYCSIEALRLADKLYRNFFESSEEIEAVLKDLIAKEIPGAVFKRTITENCVNYILRRRLLGSYKDYISSALEIIKNSEANSAMIFVR